MYEIIDRESLSFKENVIVSYPVVESDLGSGVKDLSQAVSDAVYAMKQQAKLAGKSEGLKLRFEGVIVAE